MTDFGIGGVAAMPAILEARRNSVTGTARLATALSGSCTPLYASPQQMRGDAPDVRDDVHALGVMWYQLLTGDLGSGVPTGLWADELEEQGLGKELIRLLGACVSARVEKRPPDALALAEQLSSLLQPVAPFPKARPRPPVEPPPEAPKTQPLPERIQTLLKSIEANPYSWVLDLTNKQIGDVGVTALSISPHLSRVSALYLSGNCVTDMGTRTLAASAHIVNLTRLVLSGEPHRRRGRRRPGRVAPLVQPHGSGPGEQPDRRYGRGRARCVAVPGESHGSHPGVQPHRRRRAHGTGRLAAPGQPGRAEAAGQSHQLGGSDRPQGALGKRVRIY